MDGQPPPARTRTGASPVVSPAWHAEPAAAVLARLEADADQGLASAEIARRLLAAGPNTVPTAPPPPRWRRLLRQFDNVLIHVLLLAAGVTLALGHVGDALVIAGVTLVNAVIGYLQEGRAESALASIRDLLAPQAHVLRDGDRRTVAAATVVPGDIVLLASGDRVPADLRLLETHGLRVDEAALTGESAPADKTPAVVSATAALGDRRNMAFAGTLVTWGQGAGVVVATGAATEIGRISGLLAHVTPLTTPLLRQLQHFARALAAAMLAVAAAAFLFGHLFRGYSAEEMFLASVSLAVALIPEELPALVTITLALGVQRMAARRAMVRRLPAVEALGAVTVICSDKTGTLTRNEMTVRTVVTASGRLTVSGSGYGPRGGFRRDEGTPASADEALLALARAALLCNDAALQQEAGEWRLSGDPTEGALLALALKAGLSGEALRREWPRRDAIPFESEHRFMATLHQDRDDRVQLLLKGAPERVLALCSGVRQADGSSAPLDRTAWEAAATRAAAEGQRLLALAGKALPAAPAALAVADVEAGDFLLLGLLGIEDPPREEAIAAVARCRHAGIRIKMITGDHAVTARAIGQRLGLDDEVRVLTGPDLDALDDNALEDVAQATDIVARASPEHKLRLVRALQRRGEVVAMTGDGVNDAPALKQADVGVAMGRKGTEAAREAAQIVLADDNFTSIAAAVEEGRTVHDNIRKAIVFMLPTNGGEAGLLLVAIALGLTLPILPVQILWVNMVTTVVLGLVLAFEGAEADLMARSPRPPGEALLGGLLVWRIMFVTALMVAACLGLFLWELERHAGIAEARTAVVNALVMAELAYLLNVRHFTAPVLHREGLLGNPWLPRAAAALVVLQLLFTYSPPLQRAFGTAPLDGAAWLRIAGACLLLLALVEAEKALLRRFPSHRPPQSR